MSTTYSIEKQLNVALLQAKKALDSSLNTIHTIGSNLTGESINESIEVSASDNSLKLKLKIKLPSPPDQIFQVPASVTPIKRLLYYPNFFFEFVYNIVREPNGEDFGNIINGKMSLDETHLNTDRAFSKRIVLLYEKLRSDAQFDFSNFFTHRGLIIIEHNYKLGTALWTCKLCFLDSDSNSIGCDHCNEWFHFQCINMKKIPKNEWFCAECRAKNTGKRKSMRLF